MRVFGSGELFVPQTLCHPTRKQQPIQRALIFSQHAMRSTGRKPNAHETKLTSAIASNRIDEIERFLLSTVPDDVRSH